MAVLVKCIVIDAQPKVRVSQLECSSAAVAQNGDAWFRDAACKKGKVINRNSFMLKEDSILPAYDVRQRL